MITGEQQLYIKINSNKLLTRNVLSSYSVSVRRTKLFH